MVKILRNFFLANSAHIYYNKKTGKGVLEDIFGTPWFCMNGWSRRECLKEDKV